MALNKYKLILYINLDIKYILLAKNKFVYQQAYILN